jgi:hypothetical protein
VSDARRRRYAECVRRLRLFWALLYAALLLIGLAPDEWDRVFTPGPDTPSVVALQPDLDDLGEVAQPPAPGSGGLGWRRAASSATTADMLYPSSPGPRTGAPLPDRTAVLPLPTVQPAPQLRVPMVTCPDRGPPPRATDLSTLPARAPPLA